MAVKMRLRREGKKKQPFYRVVVADGRSPRDGRFIEDLGFYHPLAEPSAISIDHERALHWLGEGVQPTQAVVNLLRISGIWEEFKPGQPDPNAERRAKRAAKRDQQVAKLEAAKERSAIEAKEAADARDAAAAEAKKAAEAPVEEAAVEEPPAEDASAGDAEEAPATDADGSTDSGGESS